MRVGRQLHELAHVDGRGRDGNGGLLESAHVAARGLTQPQRAAEEAAHVHGQVRPAAARQRCHRPAAPSRPGCGLLETRGRGRQESLRDLHLDDAEHPHPAGEARAVGTVEEGIRDGEIRPLVVDAVQVAIDAEARAIRSGPLQPAHERLGALRAEEVAEVLARGGRVGQQQGEPVVEGETVRERAPDVGPAARILPTGVLQAERVRLDQRSQQRVVAHPHPVRVRAEQKRAPGIEALQVQEPQRPAVDRGQIPVAVERALVQVPVADRRCRIGERRHAGEDARREVDPAAQLPARVGRLRGRGGGRRGCRSLDPLRPPSRQLEARGAAHRHQGSSQHSGKAQFGGAGPPAVVGQLPEQARREQRAIALQVGLDRMKGSVNVNRDVEVDDLAGLCLFLSLRLSLFLTSLEQPADQVRLQELGLVGPATGRRHSLREHGEQILRPHDLERLAGRTRVAGAKTQHRQLGARMVFAQALRQHARVRQLHGVCDRAESHCF